ASGTSVTLGLTDPDSSTVVPGDAPRFGRDFMLDSQGDLEQIYARDPLAAHPHLSVLTLTQSVDDTVFATSADGVIYATDSTDDTVDVLTGSFSDGEAIVAATPCGANDAPPVCPQLPAFPPNYVGELDLFTGTVTQLVVTGAGFVPQGGLYFSRSVR
ncbi:MAG TPA: hypothetical protein VGS21_09540, partial [Acidimicrobiales bacterium]|nr:hypothetical protein [Acidimicrobiales bacterium]